MNKIKKLVIIALVLFACLFANLVQADAFTINEKPSGVCVTYYDDIDSRGFAWQTSKNVSETKLLVSKDSANWSDAIVVDGTNVDYDYSNYRFHKAHITDLEPGRYYYKVGGNNNYSDVGSFTIDNSNDNKVSFTYVTDSQETSVAGFENFAKTLNAATLHNPDFIAFAGDLVDNSHAGWGSDMTKIKMEEWNYCFDTTKDITMNYPFMSAAGNHESAGFTHVNHSDINYAREVSTGGYYSFDYENVHFVVLNTNMYESINTSEQEKQLEWLENDLATTKATWKVVMMHIGAYSTGDHTNDHAAKTIRDVFPPLFAKYKVDLVLQGHDHVYTRTMPYLYGEDENGKIPNRNEQYIYKNGLNYSLEPDGTYYITINYAGTKSYPPDAYDTGRIFPGTSFINGKLMSQHVTSRMFAHVEVDGDELVLKSYKSYTKNEGTSSEEEVEELYDYIAIKKNTYQGAIEAIDKLGDNVTALDAPLLNEANNIVSGLSDRALLYLTDARINKLENLLKTYDLTDGLAAYDAIKAIEKLDTNNYDEEFWSNYSAANDLYFNLSETQKELVLNRDILLNVKDNINQKYYVESVQQLIDAIETSSNKEEARVIAKMAYDLLSEESKALINNADILSQSFVEEVETDGCSGSVTLSILSVVLLGSAIVIFRKRRGEDYEKN